MQDLEYIDNYFKGALPAEEAGPFEHRVLTDAPFADSVAFYCASVRAAREQSLPEKKQHFGDLYLEYNKEHSHKTPSLVRRLMPYAAVAAILAALIIGWWIWLKPVAPQQLAAAYEQDRFKTLSVKMDTRPDSLQTGLRLYNEGKPEQALRQFESMIAKNDADIKAKEFAGIVSLELKEYDKALAYFRQLEQYPGLYSNPGKFYYALTLMKRSMPGDQQKAKELLQQVVQEDLEQSDVAKKWLSKW
jgi:tetratricopeptide (TPR) repeat protein